MKHLTNLFLKLTAGNVVCSWGRGEDGQLGHGDAEDRLIPTQLSALEGHEIVSVAAGADHTTAYSESRLQVYSWGWFVPVCYVILLKLVFIIAESTEKFSGLRKRTVLKVDGLW